MHSYIGNGLNVVVLVEMHRKKIEIAVRFKMLCGWSRRTPKGERGIFPHIIPCVRCRWIQKGTLKPWQLSISNSIIWFAHMVINTKGQVFTIVWSLRYNNCRYHSDLSAFNRTICWRPHREQSHNLLRLLPLRSTPASLLTPTERFVRQESKIVTQ